MFGLGSVEIPGGPDVLQGEGQLDNEPVGSRLYGKSQVSRLAVKGGVRASQNGQLTRTSRRPGW